MDSNLCDICHKNPASIHLTEVSAPANEVKEVHICDKCASQKNLKLNAMGSFMDGLVDPGAKQNREYSKIKCPECGITYSEFRSKSRFGCPADYEIFKEGVADILEKFHGSNEFRGKMPKRIPEEVTRLKEIKTLEKELQLLIRHENYEKAAEIRDRILVLKGDKH